MDDIINEGANVLVNSGDDDDIITNYGEKSVIKGESGNDLIKNNIFDYETLNSDNFSIEVSDNSNLYTRSNAALLGGNYSTIVGGKGNDLFLNLVDYAEIYGQNDRDTVRNAG